MANCEQWREAISAYADGQCRWAERKAVEAHLRECADCQRWLEEIRADQQLFTQTVMARRADVSDAVMSRVGEMSGAKSQPVRERTPLTPWRLIQAAAALVVACVLVAVFFPVFARSREKASLMAPPGARMRASGPPGVGVEPERAVSAQLRRTTGIDTSPLRPYGPGRAPKLAYDAAVEVWVRQLQEAVRTAEETFYERGGFVLRCNMVQVESLRHPPRAEIIGKVPMKEVAKTINALAALGWVARREIVGEDLTEDYVLAERRLTHIKEKLNNLYQRRPKVSKLQQNLIDQEIEALKAELDQAQDEYFGVESELALATIQATIVEKGPGTAAAAKGVRAAWNSFTRAAAKVGVALVWLGLYGLFALPLIAGLIIYWRRRVS